MGENEYSCKNDFDLIVMESNLYNPFVNLALEEYLLQNVSGKNLILFLWQNKRSIIIGRNQNPYFECNFDVIKRFNIKIARRTTGGGAVYHDLGNLNYSIIQCSNFFSKAFNYKKILNAIRWYGFDANIDGRNDIIVDNAKVSGTAFLQGRKASLQHGCILVSSNLEMMNKCLKVNPDKLIGKRINSVKSRVKNLVDINPNIQIEDMKKKIIASFRSSCSHFEIQDIKRIEDSKGFKLLLQKYQSNQWNIGNQVDMTFTLHRRFGWGDLTFVINTDGLIIKDVGVYSDSLETDIFKNIQEAIIYSRFKKDDIINRIQRIHGSKEIVEDICNIIAEEKQIL